MKRKEFLAWVEFWKTCPFDDAGRYHRPAALIATSMGGGDMDEMLRWLEREPVVAVGYSEADLATMATFGKKPPRRPKPAKPEGT